MRAISAIASSVKTRRTDSVASNAVYCFVSAFSGSVRMRMKSAFVRASSSTRIGKRPWNSGSRSDGFATWNAPDAMKRM